MSTGAGFDSSRVTGYPGLGASAQGQNPSRSPRQTDLTKAWLGWVDRYVSKMSTRIGVTILNRWGFSFNTFVTASSSNADCGGPSSGSAVRVQSEVLGEKSKLGSQMLYRRYLGLIQYAAPLVLLGVGSVAGCLSVPCLSTLPTEMLVVTFLFGISTSILAIKSSADVFL